MAEGEVELLEFCKPYLFKKPCDNSCNKLHICKTFMLGDVCTFQKANGKGCVFGHDILTMHNSKVLYNYPQISPCLKQTQEIVANTVRNFLKKHRNRFTVPTVCDDYSEGRECSQEMHKKKCYKLHVCPLYLVGKCRKQKLCQKCHTVVDDRNSAILESFGIPAKNESQAVHHMKTWYEKLHLDQRGNKVKEVLDQSKENEPRMDSTAVKQSQTQEICLEYLTGRCNVKKCSNLHEWHKLPFTWQYQIVDNKWTFFDGPSCYKLEQDYCNVLMDSCTVSVKLGPSVADHAVVLFSKMTVTVKDTVSAGVYHVRRPSTPSSVVLVGNANATKWCWYAGVQRWTNSHDLSEEDLERVYLMDNPGFRPCTYNGIPCLVDFANMRLIIASNGKELAPLKRRPQMRKPQHAGKHRNATPSPSRQKVANLMDMKAFDIDITSPAAPPYQASRGANRGRGGGRGRGRGGGRGRGEKHQTEMQPQIVTQSYSNHKRDKGQSRSGGSNRGRGHRARSHRGGSTTSDGGDVCSRTSSAYGGSVSDGNEEADACDGSSSVISASSSHTSSAGVLRDICLGFLSGKCKKERVCGAYHCRNTYEWQYSDNGSWEPFDDGIDQYLEQLYADVTVGVCTLDKLNSDSNGFSGAEVSFITMTLTSNKRMVHDIRRMSTISDQSPMETTDVSCRQYMTTWKWYCQLEGKWQLCEDIAFLTSERLEAKYLKRGRADHVDVMLPDGDYVVDFRMMERRNQRDGSRNALRRRPAQLSASAATMGSAGNYVARQCSRQQSASDSGEDEVKDAVCLRFLLGVCTKGQKCKLAHCLHAFEWQHKINVQHWTPFNEKTGELIEKYFCNPTKDTFVIKDRPDNVNVEIDFTTMRGITPYGGNYEIRRVDTHTGADQYDEELGTLGVAEGSADRYRTVWKWHQSRDGCTNWICANTELDGSGDELSKLYEKHYAIDPHSTFPLARDGSYHDIDLKAMVERDENGVACCYLRHRPALNNVKRIMKDGDGAKGAPAQQVKSAKGAPAQQTKGAKGAPAQHPKGAKGAPASPTKIKNNKKQVNGAEGKPDEEICVTFLLDDCSAHSCPRFHGRSPFQWQYQHPGTEEWKNVPPDVNQDVEKQYCDVNTDTHILELLLDGQSDYTNFLLPFSKMLARSISSEVAVRRLSTPSSVSADGGGQQFSDQHKSQLTEWVWYWELNADTWMPYTSKITSADLEKLYQTRKNEKIILKRANTLYEFDLMNMTQENMTSKRLRAIKRRPVLRQNP